MDEMGKQKLMRLGRALNVWASVLGLVVMFCMSQRMQAQAENWQNYNYPSEGFSVTFPAAPTTNKQNVPTDAGTFELRAYLSQMGDSALYVGVCDYGAVVNGRDPNAVLQGAKQGAVDNVKAHITSESNITLGIYPGVAFEADNDTLHFSAHIYFVGTTLYQVLVASPLKTPYAGTTRFINSFQFIPRTR
jgi:hypothetical protein